MGITKNIEDLIKNNVFWIFHEELSRNFIKL